MNESRRRGVRVGLTLAAPSFVLAVTFGALAEAAGWGPLAPVAASLVVFSGSAQFALLAVLTGGGGIVPAVAAAGMVNLRFLPMALAVAPALRGGRLRRAIEGQAVVDASWAAAHHGGGRFDRDVLIASTLVQWPTWVGGTILGAVVAPAEDLMQRLGLDVLFPAFFALLLLEELRKSRRGRIAAVVAALTTAGALLLLPVGPALLLAAAGAVVGLLPARCSPGKAS